jgi:hypothetical protein
MNHVPERANTFAKLEEYYLNCPYKSSDIDLFLYGSESEIALRVINCLLCVYCVDETYLYDCYQKSLLEKEKVFLSKVISCGYYSNRVPL